MSYENNPQGVPPTGDPLQNTIDLAVEHARKQHSGPRSLARTAVIAAVVGAIGFGAGIYAPRLARHVHDHDKPATQPSTADPAANQLWTCSMHPQVIQPKPGICPICHMELTPLKAGNSGHSEGVAIDPVVVQNMGVRTTTVSRGPIVQSVRVVGYLEEPEPLHRDINLRVNGWIEKLYANVDGMVIAKGKPLFDLYSPELTVAIDELIAAERQIRRAPGDDNAKQLMESSRRKLTQLGLAPEQIAAMAKLETAPTSVPILSPIDGHLTNKMVYEGASVKAGDLVMRLASRHQMWIDAQVPEQQMGLISDGQPVRATLVSQPGKVYAGKVLFMHPHLDPKTRTALVRVQIDNQDLALRQGMYATVEILADAYREAPLLPREAVIDTGRRQVVFVALGEGRFESREVTLGLPGQNGTIEVLSGLRAGEQLVTSGQFLLDSESRLKDAVAKQLAAGLPGHGGHTASTSRPSTPAQHAHASPATTRAVARAVVPHADDILKAYLELAAKLGARQEAETPLDPKPLISIATMAAEHASGEGKALAEGVMTTAKALEGKALAEQRAAFVALSESAIKLARQARLGKDLAPTLYVMHCPMAFEDKGADWLQNDPTIANPYYATRMKRCGEVVEKITPGE